MGTSTDAAPRPVTPTPHFSNLTYITPGGEMGMDLLHGYPVDQCPLHVWEQLEGTTTHCQSLAQPHSDQASQSLYNTIVLNHSIIIQPTRFYSNCMRIQEVWHKAVAWEGNGCCLLPMCYRPWGSVCAGTHVSCATGQESVIVSAYGSGITPV
jgi:hypothetical protein